MTYQKIFGSARFYQELKNSITIGFAGLSHLGLTTSISISKFRNIKVIAFDEDKKLIDDLCYSKKIALKEPKLDSHLHKYKKNILFTNNPKELNRSDIVYISKDTQTNKENISDLKKLNDYINYIKNFINKKTILVVHSQIQLNFMDSIKWEKNNLYYHVETLIFGDALNRVLNPERIIIGCNDKRTNLPLIYLKYLKLFKSKIILMNYQSAELTKISINLFLMSSISTTNKIVEICEKTNADWFKIRESLVLDKRIGLHSYTKPGLGISGGNLERDLKAIININKKFKIDNDYFYSIEKISKNRKKWIINNIKKLGYIDSNNVYMGVLGISYKSNTNSIKNSPALEILKYYKRTNIVFYDPLVSEFETNKNHKRVSNINEVFNKLNFLIIANDTKIYGNLKISQLKKIKDKLIIDPYNTLNDINLKKLKIKHLTFGDKN